MKLEDFKKLSNLEKYDYSNNYLVTWLDKELIEEMENFGIENNIPICYFTDSYNMLSDITFLFQETNSLEKYEENIADLGVYCLKTGGTFYSFRYVVNAIKQHEHISNIYNIHKINNN